MDAGRDNDIALLKAGDLDAVVAKGFNGHIFQGQGLVFTDDPDLRRTARLIDGR